MKVLLLNRISRQRGGADKYFLELGRLLSSRGHQVGTFTARCPGDPPVENAGLFPPSFDESTDPPPSFGDKVRFFFDGIYSRPAKEGLLQLLAASKPDVAHLNNIYFQLSSSVIDALSEAGVPAVFSLHDYQAFCSNAYLYRDGAVCTLCAGGQYRHGFWNRCYRGSLAASLMSYLAKKKTEDRGILKKIAAFIVPTETMKRQVQELGLTGARIEVVPNPFKSEGLKPREAWDPYVVFYGRLIRPKGIYTLLEASRRLPRVPLRIYGSGPEEQGVSAFLREHRMDHVLFDTKLRWGPELEEIVGRARYILAPSEWPVPMDYVVCESLALGRAVLTGNVGGNQDLVRDGVCGRVFKAGDPADLARVMAELYDDVPRLKSMGAEARRTVESMCGEERYLGEILRVYGSVAKPA